MTCAMRDLVLGLLLLSLISVFPARACDDLCQTGLIQKFEALLNSKINPIKTDLKTMKADLLSFSTTIADVYVHTEGAEGRSEQSIQQTTAMKQLQETISNNIMNIQEKVESFDNRFSEETIQEIDHNLKTMKETMARNHQTMVNEIRDFKTVQETVVSDLINVKTTQQSMENKLTNIEIIQDSVENKLTNIETVQNTVENNVQSIMVKVDHLKVPITELKQEMEVSDNLILSTLVMTNEDNYRCPDGIFISTQCFVIYRDRQTNWTDAQELCQAKDLVLAEPYDTVAVALRRFLLQRHGEVGFWINGQGTGSQFMWQRDAKPLGGDNLLWSPGQPGDHVTPNFCLTIKVQKEHWNTSPDQPYHPQDCEEAQYYPLCERLLKNKSSMKSPMVNLEENISTLLNNLEDDISTSINAIDRKRIDSDKIMLRAIRLGCSVTDGFFRFGANHCFKVLKDKTRTWNDAKSECETRGLRLAEDIDAIAVDLRKYLVDNYGDDHVWLGAKSDGSNNWSWTSDGKRLESNSRLWWSSRSGNKCLLMLVSQVHWQRKPEKPYYGLHDCTTDKWYTLCQVVPE